MAKAVTDAEMIIIVVADPPAVESILDVIVPHLKPGQLVAQSSTISAHWTKLFAQRVEATGAEFLEAPFTGSKPAAEARKTVFYLGGPEKIVEKAPARARTALFLDVAYWRNRDSFVAEAGDEPQSCAYGGGAGRKPRHCPRGGDSR